MFPFDYHKKFKYSVDKKVDIEEIGQLLEADLNELKKVNNSTYSFEGFKFLLKRHRWLDSGNVSIKVDSTEIELNLSLNFIYTSVIFLFISAVFFLIYEITVSIILFLVLVTVLLLLRGWTITMYNSYFKQLLKK